MTKEIREYLSELSMEYDIIDCADIDLFETVYNEHDERYINTLIDQCAKWTLRKDEAFGRYEKKIFRDERKVCERVIGRIRNMK